MNQLRLNRPIDTVGQILKDFEGTDSGIALSTDLTEIKNLKLDTLTTSSGNIITEGSLYFKGNDGFRFELTDSFTEFSGAFTNAGDKAITMSRFASAVTQFFMYEPIASPVDYFNVTTLTNGASSINTLDVAGNDAYLGLYPDGYLSLRGKGGGTSGADLRIEYDSNDYTRIDVDDTGDITFATYDEGSQVQTGTATWSGYSTFEINSTSGVSLKLAKDANDYATFGVADTGDLTITTVGDGSLDSDFTLDIDGDIELNADGCQVTIKDGSDSHFLFDCDGTRFRIYDDANANDHFTITVGAEGSTLISTVDADTSVAHLSIAPDGHVEFDNCGVGFDLVTPTYDATNTSVDFKTGNKQFVTFGSGNITNLQLVFPATSGNFVVLIKQDGTGSRTITNYKVYDSGGSIASGSMIALFAGGSNPTLTTDANHVDIISIFWDADNEIAYAVASLDFQF